MFHLELDATAESRGDHPAVIFGDRTITHGDLVGAGQATARWLTETGVTPGDRVGWLGLNDPVLFELLYAASMLGLAIVPLNSRLTAAEHKAQLTHGNVARVLCQPDFAEALGPALPDTSVLTVVDGSLDGSADVTEFPADPTTPLLYVFTSGTTGRPKAAVHTQATLAATFENGRQASSLTADDITLGFLPLFHVGGLNIQVLPSLLAGGTVVLHDRFEPGRVLDDIEHFGATTAVFVPATMTAVIAHPRWASANLSSLRGVMTGSSVIPMPLLQAFADRGIPPGQVYGSTETGPTTVVLGFDDAIDHLGAAGRAAALSEVRIVDGELHVRGPNLFVEYDGAPEATAAAFDDGWYATGDAAHIDAAGVVRIEGRSDDLIISGGENIDPVEVEDVLAAAPGVQEVAIVGGASQRWGHAPVAFVVADATLGSPTLDELRAFGQSTLARFKLPTELHIVEELPRTALGKVQRFALRNRL